MGFICSALIRKNTKEIQSRLEKIGWVKAEYVDEYPHIETKYNMYPIGKFFGCDSGKKGEIICGIPLSLFIEGVDCDDNEELFFALSSLRDDTDENQLFIMDVEIYNDIPKGSIFYSTDIDGKYHIGTKIDPLYCHKMTKEEIIEHFSKN